MAMENQETMPLNEEDFAGTRDLIYLSDTEYVVGYFTYGVNLRRMAHGLKAFCRTHQQKFLCDTTAYAHNCHSPECICNDHDEYKVDVSQLIHFGSAWH